MDEDKRKVIYEDKKAFFDRAFKGIIIPDDIRKAAEHICQSYGIKGICDPLYIANVISMDIGRGDGKSNFWNVD